MTKKKVTLIVKERGWPELMAELRSLKESGGTQAKAGFSDQGPGSLVEHRGDLTNLELAFIHEFGATLSVPISRTIKSENTTYTHNQEVTIPERSFIRSTFDENRNSYDAFMTNVAKKVYDRQIHMREAVARLARKMAIDIRKKIDDGEGVPPPLQEETARRKGSTHTLVTTGKMRDAVVAVVQAGGQQTVMTEKLEERVEELGGGVE